MSEPRRLRRGEGYGIRDDEASRSRCSRRSPQVPTETPLAKHTAPCRGLYLLQAIFFHCRLLRLIASVLQAVHPADNGQ